MFEAVVNSSSWSELDTGDEFVNKHSSRTILEHLEKKFTEDQPVAIKEEEKLLNDPRDLAEGLSKYFARMQAIQTRMKNTDKPVQEATMKRIFEGQMKMIPHMQDAVDEWIDELDIDKKNPKSYAELQAFCIKKDLRKVDNKQILNKAGIANSIETITSEPDPRIEALETGIVDIAKGLSVMASEMKDMKMASTTEPPKQEELVVAMLKQLLTDKNQCMAVSKPDD